MARNRGVNVTRRGEGWAVVRDGAQRANQLFEIQREAIAYGRDLARGEQTELRIQGADGRWRDSDSFGNDPAPPIDRKH
jgi:hypothetical protein